jgi:hypothetical protein
MPEFGGDHMVSLASNHHQASISWRNSAAKQSIPIRSRHWRFESSPKFVFKAANFWKNGSNFLRKMPLGVLFLLPLP